MIRNIIFDWSGTLVDDLPAVWKATNYVFHRAGTAELTLAQFRAEFCLPFDSFYKRHTGDVSKGQLEEWFHHRFHEVQNEVDALPHAREFLESCRARGLRTFVLSAVHEKHFVTQAARTRFGEFIERPYLGAHDKRAVIRELIQSNQLRREETLFIGDMQHDIETARHGGVFSCAVLTGYTGLEQLRASQPDVIVEHLGELRALLEESSWHFPLASPPHRTQKTMFPITTVGALIRNDAGEVLMVRTHKWSNRWGIPGGKIKWGERAEDALRREIREETALEISGIELVLVQDCIRSPEFYRDAHFVLLNYTCRAVGETNVQLNDEAQDYRWLPTDEALRLPLNQPTRVLLEAVRDHKISQHDGRY